MTSTPHTDCDHPATKAGRAACRKMRARIATARAEAGWEIRQAYHAGAEIDEILGMMAHAGIRADPDLDIEEIVASL